MNNHAHGKTQIYKWSANMKRLLLAGVAAIAVVAGLSPARSEDIDLFIQPSGATVGLPNVLIIRTKAIQLV